jgi:DNA processing protein
MDDSINNLAQDEQTARVILALASEPGDPITGWLIRTRGAIETVQQAIADAGPTGIDGQLWQRRVASRISAEQADRAMVQGARLGLEVVIPGDPNWPTGLSALGDQAPIVLWAKGDTGLLSAPVSDRITVTGARAATGYGEHVTMELVQQAVADSRQIISGGAYGIEGMAHRAALAARGTTIAVLAGGLDRLYPAGHQDLLSRVGDYGLLLSEMPPGAAPTKWRFQQRGRILAALSGAVVIVEAGYRSGALNTAARASGVGRPVGAVPGPVTSAASAGCHRLLHDGLASIVTGYDDIRTLLTTSEKGAAARTMQNTPGLAEPWFGTGSPARNSRESGLSL